MVFFLSFLLLCPSLLPPSHTQPPRPVTALLQPQGRGGELEHSGRGARRQEKKRESLFGRLLGEIPGSQLPPCCPPPSSAPAVKPFSEERPPYAGPSDPESQVRNVQVGPFLSHKLRVYHNKTSSCAVRLRLFGFTKAHLMT